MVDLTACDLKQGVGYLVGTFISSAAQMHAKWCSFGTKISAYHKSYEERCDASRLSAQAIHALAAAGEDQQLMAKFRNMGLQPNSNWMQ